MDRNLNTLGARRTFLKATGATGATMLTGGLGSLLSPAALAAKPGDPIWIEKTMPQLQALMSSVRSPAGNLPAAICSAWPS